MGQRMILAVLAGSLLAVALQAQQPVGAGPCPLNFRGNFRLNGAQQYIAQMSRATSQDDKNRRANDALRVLGEAAGAGNADQLTLWYFMAQAYAAKRDLVGADSAFRRAEAVATPECKVEITRMRRNEFVPFNNAGVAHMQAQRFDSALASFRQGMVIFRGEPAAYLNMATIYMNQENEDSAVAYYRLAARSSDDPRTLTLRATGLFNAGRVMQRARRWPQADSLFREYLRLKPGDSEARSALATVLTQMGRRAEAMAMYDSTLANADSLESFDLFETGVALFRMAQADSLPADTARRKQLFGKAARAFELGLVKNPHHRDALYNLTNTYLASGDSARTLEAAKRLVAADPMNSQSLRLLAAAYNRIATPLADAARRAQAARDAPTVARLRPLVQAWQDSTLRALARIDSIPWELQITRFDPRDSSAAFNGIVTNRQNRELAGFTLPIEFVNAAGEVVVRENIEIPALNAANSGAGNSYDFNVTANGVGIIAYRYRGPAASGGR